MPVLILGLSALCQIKFDQYVIVGFILTTIVNAIFTVSILGAISESWNRKEAFDKKEFKFIVNVTLTNS
ncbi:MAG: hypothetical protein MJ223_01100 [Mycoplasmoidaceae bacterium]|nr:hypothetical protein [Mycoplasmoidaceae bacterium]